MAISHLLPEDARIVSDRIYLIDPATRRPAAVEPVPFPRIGIKEREDLEQWVLNHPEILGEDLLIVTSEFSRFDKSDRRLDVLALDKNGSLVVVELKLNIARTLADQQAIRYAAFCSTMTMADVISCLAQHSKCDSDQAQRQIADFLGTEDLPELNGRPRVILAAGSMDDQDLTACVLWLRTFGLDISCVELTPYELPGQQQIVLVPKTIIPVPEARDYQVRVERREVTRDRRPPFAGDWFFNTNETYSPGAWTRMLDQGVIAVYGDLSGKDAAELLNRPKTGERVFAYLNQRGIVAVGRVGESPAYSADSVFGKKHDREYHRAVEWECRVASGRPEQAVPLSAIEEWGYFLPIRATLGQMRVAKQLADRIQTQLTRNVVSAAGGDAVQT